MFFNKDILIETLVKNKMLTKKQISSLLEERKQTGESLRKILVNKNYLSESTILNIYEKHFGIPQVEISSELLNSEIINLIPQELIRKNKIFPYKQVANQLILLMFDPLDNLIIDNIILLTGLQVKPVTAQESKLVDLMTNFFNNFNREEIVVMERKEEYEDNFLIKTVNDIINQAINMRASDIHFEPKEQGVVIRYRIDGLLQKIYDLPKDLLYSMNSRIKLMANLDIAERRIPQDGRIKFNFAGRDIDLRVSTLPVVFGEKVVIRILDKEQKFLKLAELGFTDYNLNLFKKLINLSHGMILATGPAGSGKTTTLYAALNEINNNTRNIITIEDPVEYILPGINQVQVNSKAGLTFSRGLRAILRQDPDVIMLGEIRDKETAEIAIKSATSGHLVFSTLHTSDTAASLTRLINIGIEPFLVASATMGVVSQRLVRRICLKCKYSYRPNFSPLELSLLGEELISKEIFLSKGKGCSYCNYTGFFGRIAIYEILRITHLERKLILNKADSEFIKNDLIARGLQTLQLDGIEKILKGITTIEEVIRVINGGE